MRPGHGRIGTRPGQGRDKTGLYHRLGVRQALFADNLNNAAGGGCHDEDRGLTDFGRAVVQEMNRAGMLVDCSHSAYRTTMEAMEVSSAPVVFSHSNPKALWDHGRNIRDDQIKACAATGGVVGVNGLGLDYAYGDVDLAEALSARPHYWPPDQRSLAFLLLPIVVVPRPFARRPSRAD